MGRAYVALIMLATVFLMACYKIVVQRSLISRYTMEYFKCHLYFIGKESKYKVTGGIFNISEFSAPNF